MIDATRLERATGAGLARRTVVLGRYTVSFDPGDEDLGTSPGWVVADGRGVVVTDDTTEAGALEAARELARDDLRERIELGILDQDLATLATVADLLGELPPGSLADPASAPLDAPADPADDDASDYLSN